MRRLGFVAALSITLASGGLSAQVASADDDTDPPNRQEVQEAEAAAEAAVSDVDSVQAALDAATARLEESAMAAAQASEAFNGARWRAGQARVAANKAAARAEAAEEDVEELRDIYADSVVTSYTQGSRLSALSAVVDSDGLQTMLERSATQRNVSEALDGEYDDYREAETEALETSTEADETSEAATTAADDARTARDEAEAAATSAAAEAQSVAQEKTRLLDEMARLQGVSVELAEDRQSALDARRQEELREQQEQLAEEEEEEEESPAGPEEDPAPSEEPADEPSETPSAPPTEDPAPQPDPDPPAPGGGASAAIAFARAQLGEPYVWGAAGPSSWDCSGLTMGAWQAGGRSLPHYSVAQYQSSTPISPSQLQPGDLVFWGSSSSSSSIYHVAMYVGDGQIIHAPRTGRPVVEESMYYWITPNFYARP